jgi:DNA-binding transcriptional MerR regulator
VPSDDEMRLDDLAAAAGVASSTIRLYRQRGLLPPPRLVGRTGWFGPAHLARLRLIARLQEQGFSLAGIGHLLESWEEGRDLTDLVGMEATLDDLLGSRAVLVLTPAELIDRFPTGVLTPEHLQRAVALGLVEPTDDGRVRVRDPRFLEAGAALADLGVPTGVILDEWEQLARHTDAVAERFVAVFEDHVLAEGWRDHLDAETVATLAASLRRLQHLAGQVTLAALDASVAKVGARRLGELVPADDDRGRPRS